MDNAALAQSLAAPDEAMPLVLKSVGSFYGGHGQLWLAMNEWPDTIRIAHDLMPKSGRLRLDCENGHAEYVRTSAGALYAMCRKVSSSIDRTMQLPGSDWGPGVTRTVTY